MFLAQRCADGFDAKTKARGGEYFRSGHVSIKQVQGTHASAHIMGSYGDPYVVELDWSAAGDGFLSGSCNCPRFEDGYLCKHLWALILKLDDKGYDGRVPGRGQLELVDFDDWEDDGWDDEDWSKDDWIDPPPARQAPPRSRSADRTPYVTNGGSRAAVATARAGRSASSRAPWREILESLTASGLPRRDPRQLVESVLKGGDRLAWYVISVAASQYEGELVIELAQQERRADGTLTEPAPTSIREDRLVQFRDPSDQRILAWAFEHAVDDFEVAIHGTYGGYGAIPKLESMPVGPHEFDSILPELCSTGRLVWSLTGVEDLGSARSIAWDAGGAWKFVPWVAASNDSGGWILDGSLVRGDEKRCLSDVVLALKGLVLFEDRSSPLERDDHLALLDHMRNAGPISIPAKDRDEFLETLLRLPYFDALELPDELRLPEAEVSPRPLLRVQAPAQGSYAPRGELQGEILFRYGDTEISLGDPRERVLDAEHRRLMPRSGPREEHRLADLRGLPIRLPRAYDGGPGEVRIELSQLDELVEKLLGLGWDVEAEGLLVKKPGRFDIQVVSNVDWFELQGSVDYEGTVVQLPALLAAVKRGEKYVRLDDGSQGMLPEEWLARFEKLAGLGNEEQDGICFGRSQALLLDALLAEHDDARTDRTFRKFRDRLRSFTGIRPGRPPRGFQGELRDYQKAGLGWFRFLEDLSFGGCLADDMGLGKTIQVLGLLQQRRTRPTSKEERQPSLCVVPKSLVFNWIDEAARFTPRLRVVNYTGIDRKQRGNDLDAADLIVTTYGTLRRDVIELKDRKFDYVILDEAQAIKNHNSQSAKACRLLSARHRLALTGTPIENHLGELWSLFEFLNPGMLGKCTAFTSLCRGIRNNGNGEALGDLAKAISPFVLRRTKEQVLKELPEKTEQTIHCELSRKERKEYDSLRNYYRAHLTKQVDDLGMDKARFHVLEALLRLRQAACHPGLLDKKKTDQPSAKLEALLDQVREVTEEGHKALVFSQFTSLLAIVRQHLDKANIRYEYLDGRTRKRKDRVERFQSDPACPLFLISLKAGGHGLNLTAADYVFILDPWWNPAVEAQAIDRTHRIGQTRRVFAYRLIAKDTVEEKVLELQEQKRELADAIITANESLIRKLTTEDLQRILS